MDRRKNDREPGDPWATTLRLLTRRDYGTEELRRRLLDKGFASQAVDAAVARASELGYLDDERYTATLTRSFVASGRAVGPRLSLELKRRRLPAELIGAAVSASRQTGAEEQSLRDLIARRFPAFDLTAANERERRRVVNFLQRRGFPLDRILTELKRTDP